MLVDTKVSEQHDLLLSTQYHHHLHHRVLVDTKLRDNISDMIAYEKHTSDGDNKQQKLKDHFEELRERQRLAQREFHQKLFNELQKEVSSC